MIKKNRITFILFFILFSFLTFGAAAQTDETPKPKASYEYIAPLHISDFMTALKEAGKRGHRFHKMTNVPYSLPNSDKKKKNELVLTGIVKYEGGNQYDYNFFFAEGEKDAEATLNNLSKEGWYFRDVLSIMNSLTEIKLPVNDVFANRSKELPALGNLYLLERVEGEKTPRIYKLLKAGVGTGRTPTVKLQAMMDQALTEGFVPIATYLTIDLKFLLKIDAASAILLEKRDTVEKREYKFVRGNQSDGLWKDIDEFTKQGFRINFINYNTAMLYREAGETSPVSYIHLHSGEKTFQTDLATTLAKNPSFYGTVSYGDGAWMKLLKNHLIFEHDSTAATEYKFVNVLPVVPKQYRKNPEEFAKTLESPELVIQKSLDEGYAPRDIYYSSSDGLIIIFTREKKQ